MSDETTPGSAFDDRYAVPFRIGSELTADSFKLVAQDRIYMLAGARYKQFFQSYIQPRINQYRGWVDGYHNTEYGVLPTLFLQKVGRGIINTIFAKEPVLNTEADKTEVVIDKQWKKCRFNQALREAYSHALEGGSGLLKWNKDGKDQLRAEAIPMGHFFPRVGAYDDIDAIRCYIATYHDTINAPFEYHLCEERFFRVRTIKGVRMRFPMVHYLIYKTSTNVATETLPRPYPCKYADLPFDIQQLLKKDYGDIFLDLNTCEEFKQDMDYVNCKLLPFNDDLGCRFIKFTETIPEFPKMPFGQPLSSVLMNESFQYDQLKFFERLEVYLARGRVMMPKEYDNPNDPESKKTALDPLVFTKYNTTPGGTENKPEDFQHDLRAEDINRQKMNILNDTAFAIGCSSTTVASWLSDGQTQKTATEIEYERTKTTAFINEKVAIIQEPLQEFIDIFFYYYGAESPELHLMPETQTVVSEDIKLHSELFDKGQVTAEILAKKILGTCSAKEVKELAEFIKAQKSAQAMMPQVVPK
jgi:hypothetical protein